MEQTRSKPWQLNRKVALFVTVLMGLVFISAYGWLHLTLGGWDWRMCFRPATLRLLSGQTPYEGLGLYSPPWLLIMLIPFALLPAKVGALLIGLIDIAVGGYVAYRMKARPEVVVAVMLSAPLVWESLLSNIDWLPMLGLLMPPQIGLFFVLIKPQLGLGVALFWLITSWQEGGLRRVIKVFAPVGIAFAISFAIFGVYVKDATALLGKEWNVSLWPYGIPVGFFLLYLALREKKIDFSISASYFFASFFNQASLAFPLLGLVRFSRWVVLLSILSWIFFAFHQGWIGFPFAFP